MTPQATTYLVAPELTAVLAELEETIGGLVARQRSARPAIDREDVPSVVAQHGCEEVWHQTAAFAAPASAAALRCYDEVLCPPATVCPLSIAPSPFVGSPITSHGSRGEVEAPFAGSHLQSTIDSQIRALEDITNFADDLDAADNGKAKKQGEAFTDVRFLRHARALPCRHCSQHFFPKSLKFHEAACVRRITEELVQCPRCSCELPRSELLQHVAKCGKALQRVLELSRRLEEEANSPSCSHVEARQTAAPPEFPQPSPPGKPEGLVQVSAEARWAMQELEIQAHVRQECMPPLSLESLEFAVRPEVPRVSVCRRPKDDHLHAHESAPRAQHRINGLSSRSSGKGAGARRPEMYCANPLDGLASRGLGKVTGARQRKDSQGSEALSAVAPSAGDPLVQMAALQQQMWALGEELGKLPVAMDIIEKIQMSEELRC